MELTNPGWTYWLVSLSVLSALQFLAVGLLGEYLWRIADEVRGGPSYVIRSRIGVGEAPAKEGLEESENAPVWQEHKVASWGR